MDTIKQRLGIIKTTLPLVEKYVEGMTEDELFFSVTNSEMNRMSEWSNIDTLVDAAIEGKDAFLEELEVWSKLEPINDWDDLIDPTDFLFKEE